MICTQNKHLRWYGNRQHRIRDGCADIGTFVGELNGASVVDIGVLVGDIVGSTVVGCDV